MNLIIVYISIIILAFSASFSIMSFVIRIKGYVFNVIFKWSLFVGTLILLIALIRNIGLLESLFQIESIGFEKINWIIVATVLVLFSKWIIMRGDKIKGLELKVITAVLTFNVFFMIYSMQGDKMNIWNMCFC